MDGLAGTEESDYPLAPKKQKTKIKDKNNRQTKSKEPGWRNGRLGGLKSPFPRGSVGSSPTPGTARSVRIVIPSFCPHVVIHSSSSGSGAAFIVN